MSRKKMRLITAVLLFLGFLLFQSNPQKTPEEKVLSQKDTAPAVADLTVTDVIDGDTIVVIVNQKREKVRIIGINTPETVDPRREVECYGKEASDYAKSLLLNKQVKLESDPSQSDRDRYSRILRYVFLSDGTDFGMLMIKEGYAYEYTYDNPYKYQSAYKIAQIEAENLKKGLWGEGKCPN